MSRFHLTGVLCCALAAALAACSGAANAPGSIAVPPPQLVRSDAKPGPLTVTPTKLAFTTQKMLELTVSETNYTAKFQIRSQSTQIASVKPRTADGPGPATITVSKGGSAGKSTIVVTDNHGGSVTVHVSVTNGVVVIQ